MALYRYFYGGQNFVQYPNTSEGFNRAVADVRVYGGFLRDTSQDITTVDNAKLRLTDIERVLETMPASSVVVSDAYDHILRAYNALDRLDWPAANVAILAATNYLNQAYAQNDDTPAPDAAPAEERELARMLCVVCGVTHPIQGFTVCGSCSDALHTGTTLEMPRTYMMPNRVDTVVSFRLNDDGDVEWMFPDDGTWAVCTGHAQLDPGMPTPYVEEVKDSAGTTMFRNLDAKAIGLAMIRGGTITALALAFTINTAHAQSAPAPPAGCFQIGITNPQDEGFPIALCDDGTYLYADMDSGGQWKDGTTYARFGIYAQCS